MAREKQNVGNQGGTGENEKTGEPEKLGGPAPATSVRPQERSAPGNGGTVAMATERPGERPGETPGETPGVIPPPARKPRQSQPTELAELVQSEETRRRIVQSLPRHLTPDRWISVLLTI